MAKETDPRTVLRPDVCVIGAGSGGLSVAAACASFGVDVVLIERHRMGGDCLNYGCVPSKALIAAGKMAHAHTRSAAFGIRYPAPEIDFGRVHDHVHEVIAGIAPMDSVERFEALGVTVLEADARFLDKRTVEAGDTLVRARRFVVAAGSSPLVPPIEGLADVPYHTNETLFDRKEPPGRMVVVGGGPIGMEMAQAHERLGGDVTVVEGARALGREDPELAAIVVDTLRAEGVTIRENTLVKRVERGSDGTTVTVHVEGPDGADAIPADTLLVATGRRANTDGLGLAEAGIETTGNGIKVSRKLRTANRRVYAIGDVADPPDANGEHTGGLQFTHVAGYHAGLVVRAILFRLNAAEDRTIIPRVTFTDPALAQVGLTEEQARERGKALRVLRWPYAENDRAAAERLASGLIKVVTDGKGNILGATIVGHDAGELANMWSLAVSKEMNVRDIAGYVAPYPTMSEIGKRAATSFFAPATRRTIVRRAVGFLSRFG